MSMRYNYASSIRRYAFCGLLMTASMSAHAQDISQIAQSDPLIITGVIGTNNTYYHS